MKLKGYKIIFIETRDYGSTYGEPTELNVLSYSKKSAVQTFNAVHGRWCKIVSVNQNIL